MYIILAIIIFLLCTVSYWLLISTIVIGFGIICIGNISCLASKNRFAPLWWQILTVAVTICSTGMLWSDIFRDSIDTGALPFIILLGYGIGSLILFKVCPSAQQKSECIDLDGEDFDADDNTSVEAAPVLPDEFLVSRFRTILADSLKLMDTTTSPKTFFGRYADALASAEQIISTTQNSGHKAYAEKVIRDLKRNREEKIIAFIDRCNRKGMLYSAKHELLSGSYDLSPALVSYINRLLEDEEDETDVPASGSYIYCSLSFGSEGKTYFYKTTDETLTCGDEVIVPVGSEGKKAIARIEKMEIFKAGQTPYPPKYTKNILGKCEY